MSKNIIISILIFTLLFGFGCSKKKENKIVIGSKEFTEQIILGEMLSLLIENKTELKVDKKLNLGGTFICHNALKQGDIDMYVEYTGTALTAILARKAMSDPDKVYDYVKDVYKKKFNVIWLEPLGFNNTYTLTVRKDTKSKYDLETISDLEKVKDKLQAGFDHEFLSRPDGYDGLIKAYGFKFDKHPLDMDAGLMYMAIKENKVDVICGFKTDGRIPEFNLEVLEDDKQFFPPYYAVPIVRQDVLKKHPELKEVLNKLAGKITDEKMMKMNYEVDMKKRDPREVAKEFLEKNGLL